MTDGPDVADSDRKGDHQATGSSAYEFARWKNTVLSKIDLSRKGSIDKEIHDLVNFINGQSDYFTTSSCSGRILLCSDGVSSLKYVGSKGETNIKKGCHWFFVSHEIFDINALTSALSDVNCASKFKFEPFVLHAQCRTLEAARLLHRVAVESGFRNSGITFGKGGKKIIAAVRGTSCLEVPITDDKGDTLVPVDYVKYIAKLSHEKLTANVSAIDKFYLNLRNALEGQSDEMTNQSERRAVYRRRGKVARSEMKTSNHDSIEPITLFGDDFL